MYQAVMVDDEAEVLQANKSMLIKEFQSKNISVAFDFFTDSEAFLKTLNSHIHYDILFLDIEMPHMDGITLCRRIREISPDALVIFISNKEELVFQSFEVSPFRFIRKSELSQLIPSLADAIITELNRRSPVKLKITEAGGDIISFDPRTILYAEAQRKECLIVTKNGTQLIRFKFMDLENLLTDYHFIKIHRSYLVNMDYISRITKASVILTDKTELPISRGSSEKIKQIFITYSN
ncbi:MAG: LytTR family DNA-binding domain-containing protein [Lachnospiraceae bacterium]|nr:LytTR family DNA-binding domain-containing protein [Lachnospiraceae bacterium]